MVDPRYTAYCPRCQCSSPFARWRSERYGQPVDRVQAVYGSLICGHPVRVIMADARVRAWPEQAVA